LAKADYDQIRNTAIASVLEGYLLDTRNMTATKFDVPNFLGLHGCAGGRMVRTWSPMAMAISCKGQIEKRRFFYFFFFAAAPSYLNVACTST